jgi:DNA (cytosine-5)-methyltransferase 1
MTATTGAIVDLFAGPGGWDEGLRQLGRTDVIGLELDADACATAEAAGHRRRQCDVSAVNPATYRGAEGLIASPPCQDWSSAGRRSDGGTRELTEQVIRWSRAVRPRWIVCEQVRDVLPTWQDYARTLAAEGYKVTTALLDAANHGAPQHRFRAFLWAHRDLQPHAPKATHAQVPGMFGEEPWITMQDAVGWDGLIDRRTNSRGPRGTVVPTVLVPTNRPSPTVTGQASGAGQWLYQPRGADEWRPVTVEETATLQTFPADYPWQGSKKSRGQQVGNAVPPTLARAVLGQFVHAEVGV